MACLLSAGCKDEGKVSAEHATKHVQVVAKLATQDVEEVKRGLPEGVKQLLPLFKDPDKRLAEDPQRARAGLDKARRKVQDLRVAKSTFFAIAEPDGKIIRNDQEQDRMAGKNILKAFPGLKPTATGGFAETRGSMPEAAAVGGDLPDGQWVIGQGIKRDGKTVGLYVTGWSWSAYAYRLENSLRSDLRLKKEESSDKNAKLPLVYVYMIVDSEVYGAPQSPRVNAEAIKKTKPALSATPTSAQLEITRRAFGLATVALPVFGPDVGVAVLRSET